ncbi:MAG: preprotein translocase subunit YajC [bacterium]
MLSMGLLAMAANTTQGQPQGGGFGASLIVLILIFVIFYFLLIRPQQKQQKKMMDMRASLKKGDKVITTGGIYGVILAITDEIVSLQIADKVKIDIAKSSIAGKREEGN